MNIYTRETFFSTFKLSNYFVESFSRSSCWLSESASNKNLANSVTKSMLCFHHRAMNRNVLSSIYQQQQQSYSFLKQDLVWYSWLCLMILSWWQLSLTRVLIKLKEVSKISRVHNWEFTCICLQSFHHRNMLSFWFSKEFFMIFIIRVNDSIISGWIRKDQE